VKYAPEVVKPVIVVAVFVVGLVKSERSFINKEPEIAVKSSVVGL
jgi:hypothetical protein